MSGHDTAKAAMHIQLLGDLKEQLGLQQDIDPFGHEFREKVRRALASNIGRIVSVKPLDVTAEDVEQQRLRFRVVAMVPTITVSWEEPEQ